MAIFDKIKSFFVLEKEVKPRAGISAVDELLFYVLSLINRKDLISEQIKKYEQVKRLPRAEREFAYIPIYLALEKFILANKPLVIKRAFTKGSLREEIKKNIQLEKLDEKFRLLLLPETEQVFTLYNLALNFPIQYIRTNLGPKRVQSFVATAIKGTILEKTRFDGLRFYFESLRKRKISQDEIISSFSQLSYALSDEIRIRLGEKAAGEVIAKTYRFVQTTYGDEFTSQILKVLPRVILAKEERIVPEAVDIISYVVDLISDKAKIQSQLVKIGAIKELAKEEQEPFYVKIYFELEKALISEQPNKYSTKTLREAIRNAFKLEEARTRLTIFFLRPEVQQIKLIELLLGGLVKKLVPRIGVSEIQKAIEKTTEETLLKGIVVTKTGIDFIKAERMFFELPEQWLRLVLINAQELLSVIFSKAEQVLGGVDFRAAVEEVYQSLKREFGTLPIFSDMVKLLPPGVLDIEKLGLMTRTELEEEVKKRTAELEEAYRRQIEREKEIRRLREQFVFIAAHELNSPVNAIKWGLGSILEDEKTFKALPENVAAVIEKVYTTNERLINLIEDLLEISRLEKGVIKVKVEEVDLRKAIKETIQDLSHLAAKMSVEIRWKDKGKPLPLVRANLDLVREIFTNLLNNAIRFNKKGGWVFISSEKTQTDLIFHIQDSGIGMTKEEMKGLFQQFYRVENRETRDIKGTGLGLFIVKQILERMKGRIWVESKKGEGSVFSFSLPLALS